MELITEPHIDRPDDFYEALIEAHRGLSPQQSQALNARLVLLLANHVGDMRVLTQAMAHARDATEGAGFLARFQLGLQARFQAGVQAKPEAKG